MSRLRLSSAVIFAVLTLFVVTGLWRWADFQGGTVRILQVQGQRALDPKMMTGRGLVLPRSEGPSLLLVRYPEHQVDGGGADYVALGSEAGAFRPQVSTRVLSTRRDGYLGQLVTRSTDWDGDGLDDVLLGDPYLFERSVMLVWIASSDGSVIRQEVIELPKGWEFAGSIAEIELESGTRRVVLKLRSLDRIRTCVWSQVVESKEGLNWMHQGLNEHRGVVEVYSVVDLNQDGSEDLLVRTRRASGESELIVLCGASGALLYSIQALADGKALPLARVALLERGGDGVELVLSDDEQRLTYIWRVSLKRSGLDSAEMLIGVPWIASDLVSAGEVFVANQVLPLYSGSNRDEEWVHPMFLNQDGSWCALIDASVNGTAGFPHSFFGKLDDSGGGWGVWMFKEPLTGDLLVDALRDPIAVDSTQVGLRRLEALPAPNLRLVLREVSRK